MRKLLMKFQSFMQYRYTRMDHITWTCFFVGLILGIVGRVVLKYHFYTGVVLEVAEYCLMVYALWRPFSKGIWKRDKENRAFVAFFRRIKNWFLLCGRRIKFIKTSVFRVCPHCKAQLKLPRKRGKHTVKCPKCYTRFDVKIAFGKK